MDREIERKYLLPAFPEDLIAQGELLIVGKKTIEQTYLALTEDQEIRVRKLTANQEAPVYTHTFKRGRGMAREEAEYEISGEIYRQLLEHSGRQPLIKTRTKVRAASDPEGFVFEIDEYHQYNLMTVEAEFASEEAAASFAPPAWFGQEVGGELEYRNKRLWASLQKK